jgi:hypothetical protein
MLCQAQARLCYVRLRLGYVMLCQARLGYVMSGYARVWNVRQG